MAIIPTQAIMRLNESWFKPTKHRIFFSKLMSYKLMRVNATIHGMFQMNIQGKDNKYV